MQLDSCDDKETGNKPNFRLPIWLLLIFIGVFLSISYSPIHHWDEYFYLYTVNHFSLTELLQVEPDLALGLFPQAFFSAKIAFVSLLYFLIRVLGDGYLSLLIIQSVFAMHVLVFAGVSYLLLHEIFGKKIAQRSVIVLLFLPLSMYFSYKVLSELLSLTAIVTGSWMYLRSLRCQTQKSFIGIFTLALFFLLGGILCRFTSVVFFGGMVISLLVVGDTRYPRWKLFFSAAVATILLLIFSLICYRFLVGLSLEELAGLLGSVTVRNHGIAIKIYSIFMTIQLFAIPFLAITRVIYKPTVIFSLLWAFICSVVFVFLSEYVEPRYFYMVLVPQAVLIYYGLTEMSRYLKKKNSLNQRYIFYILLFTCVAGNRLFLTDLMTYEHNQNEYKQIMETIEYDNSSATYLIPWISDYCLLKYIYPEKDIHLTWSSVDGKLNSFFNHPTFIKWAGGEKYFGSQFGPDQVSELSDPIYYVGWRYNQPAIKIKKNMMWLKSGYVDSIEAHEGLKNHLELSWIWKEKTLRLTPYKSLGQYEAFIVTPNLQESK